MKECRSPGTDLLSDHPMGVCAWARQQPLFRVFLADSDKTGSILRMLMLLLAIAQLGNGRDTRAFNYLDYLDSSGFGDVHKEDKSAAPVPKASKTKPESIDARCFEESFSNYVRDHYFPRISEGNSRQFPAANLSRVMAGGQPVRRSGARFHSPRSARVS